MPDRTVVCRARVVDECLHGRPASSVYPEGVSIEEDGTYSDKSGTVICDACYVAVQPLARVVDGRERLDEAVANYRAAKHIKKEEQ